ncbi:MAG: hypothetical protein AB7Q29_11005 [Vicinamibacterales bacterium]
MTAAASEGDVTPPAPPASIGPIRVLITACWTAISALCAVAITYPHIGSPSWQPTIIGLVFLSSAVVAAAAGASGWLSRRMGHRLVLAGVAIVMTLLPVALLRAGRDNLTAAMAAGCLIAAGAWVFVPHRRWNWPQPLRAATGASIVGVLLLAAWLMAGVTLLADASTPKPWDIMAISVLAPALGLMFLPLYDLSAIAAVTAGALSRPRAVIDRLEDGGTRTLLILIAAKTLYVALRISVAPDLFGDGQLWDLSRSARSWAHAGLLAGLVTVLALRSDRRPMSSRGWNAAALLVALVPALPQIPDIIDFLLFAGAFLQSPATAPDFIESWFESDRWQRAIVLAMPAMVLALGGTAAWWSRRRAWSAGVLVLGLAFAAMLPQTLAPFTGGGAALPAQMDLLITAAVTTMIALRRAHVAKRALRIPPTENRALIRLVIVPFAALHAVALIPAVWESRFLPELAVAAVIASAATRERLRSDAIAHAGRLLKTLALEIAGLVTLVLVELTDQARHLEGLGGSATLALLLLAVPLGGALCCRMEPSDRAAGSG